MRKIIVIGIGAGDPDHLTLQAVKALNQVDVFFILDKGEEKSDLVQLRHDIIEQHVTRPHRLVSAQDPPRDRTAPDPAYASAVGDWRHHRGDIYEHFIGTDLADGECGAFLVWGDPALYDSTLGILEDVRDRGTVAFDYEVVPGISSVSALAAKHRTGLNRLARPVQITTGRQLAEGFPEGTDDVVVMLDAHQAFAGIEDEDVSIFWGAYLGTPDELLVAGRLADVAGRIQTLRAEARARKGWIMDTYLLRRDRD
ncbi:precorrin-6A synthase (deacetylating) [Streptomyces sp. H10-C2]|uniref:precorrin-6A synthase (deacetylating) n=1 Tax=unclassified Streptomyces TaxID=2593676 RepID=UPI0024B8B35C|nr:MULTISPECIES: precorrin-6A synthase (deacetylating) [unclassified Streptomyces]MDJ0344066.1 precorrin-6A synthase (deacetylating) [Streptomyces sp. PH10-H1]MDJ0368605.1 precorrin-6A synthase (deacetylating) [Streptomyces sp. H10-C2]